MIALGGTPDWTKSSYTVQNACVEVRSAVPSALDITDSKYRWGREGAPVVSLSPAAFTSLVAVAKAAGSVRA